MTRKRRTTTAIAATITSQSTGATLLDGADRDPDGVFAAAVGPPVEPAVARLDDEARLAEQGAPLGRREPGEHHRRLARVAADGERQRPRLRVPVGPLVDPGLPLEPAPVRLGDVVGAGREDVEDEPPTGHEHLADGRERPPPVGIGAQVEVGAERAGDERDALLDGRLAQVAETEVEQLRDAGALGPLAADVEHPGRGVDADHAHPGSGGRDRDPARSDPELDDRASGLARLLDVEADVLGDADAPRVVEPRDRVVGRQEADGTFAAWTGKRSNDAGSQSTSAPRAPTRSPLCTSSTW